MIEDGAWAVPSIKDNDGKTVKANWISEIMIRFIAHELNCHMIVFYLLLNSNFSLETMARVAMLYLILVC